MKTKKIFVFRCGSTRSHYFLLKSIIYKILQIYMRMQKRLIICDGTCGILNAVDGRSDQNIMSAK